MDVLAWHVFFVFSVPFLTIPKVPFAPSGCFHITVYYKPKIFLLVGNSSQSIIIQEKLELFFHLHHFTFIYTEFHVSFYCLDT